MCEGSSSTVATAPRRSNYESRCEADKRRAEMEEPLLNTLRFPLTLDLSHQVLKCTLSRSSSQIELGSLIQCL